MKHRIGGSSVVIILIMSLIFAGLVLIYQTMRVQTLLEQEGLTSNKWEVSFLEQQRLIESDRLSDWSVMHGRLVIHMAHC
jgi:hypothetical protein